MTSSRTSPLFPRGVALSLPIDRSALALSPLPAGRGGRSRQAAEPSAEMSLAEGRAPRRTAGNRLSGLLQAEEEDEFYQTTYGGFNEASGPGRERREASQSRRERGEAGGNGAGALRGRERSGVKT